MTATLALLASLALPFPAQAVDGADLLRGINAAHKATWFTTMTFIQRTTWADDRPEEIWYETMQRPGMLRLDMERNGEIFQSVIFRNDSVYVRNGGTARPPRPLVHALLVLLHDIHVGDIEMAIGKLRQSGFDLATTHETRWRDRAVTVVGAAAGDSTSAQFWVDSERLVVVRVIQPTNAGGTSDIHVGAFTRQGPSLVEGEILFHANGAPGMREVYTQVKTGMPLDPMIFDPGHGELPAWVVAARAGGN